MPNGSLVYLYPMCFSLNQVFQDSGKMPTNVCINKTKVGRKEEKRSKIT